MLQRHDIYFMYIDFPKLCVSSETLLEKDKAILKQSREAV